MSKCSRRLRSEVFGRNSGIDAGRSAHGPPIARDDRKNIVQIERFGAIDPWRGFRGALRNGAEMARQHGELGVKGLNGLGERSDRVGLGLF